jgi:biopolymer transport protein ExbD
MAMNVSGTGGGVKSDINITPLVDVVLVLLIIFMVVTPILQMGHEVQVPPKVETAAPPPMQDQVIVRLDAAGTPWINKQSFPMAEFPARLSQVLTGRSSKVIFFAADGELPYGQVATFMEMCRNSGAQNLGIVFDDMKGGPAAPAAGAAAAPATGG